MQDSFQVNQPKPTQTQPTCECIISQKIYGQCRQQDCLQPSAESNSTVPSVTIDSARLAGEQSINTTTPNILAGGSNSIKPGSIIAVGSEVTGAKIVPGSFAVGNIVISSVTPNSFGQSGYWDITIKYEFTYNLNLLNSSNIPISVNLGSTSGTATTSIPAYSTYTKVISLFGGAGNSQTVFMASTLYNPQFTYTMSNAPYVMVQAIANPLQVTLGTYTQVGAASQNQVDVSIGLFTIVKAYRLVDMSVESNGNCDIPVSEPLPTGDPCSSFNSLPFPFDEFNPPITSTPPTPPTSTPPTNA